MTEIFYRPIKHWVYQSLVATFSVVSCLTQVFAAEGRHALIIGIGEYSEESNTTTLHGIPVDMVNARRMATEMGVPSESIVELRNDLATKDNIQSEFKKLAEKVNVGDRVFIYHSGHGARYLQGNVCVEGLQTYTKGKFTVADVLSEAEIAVFTKPISEKADKVLMVIDTCFSGGVINATTRSLSTALDIRPKNNPNNQQCDLGVNQVTPRSLLGELTRFGIHQENFVQIAAANNNEVSWDTKELGGLATHTLTQCLMGDATDLNTSGAISLDEIKACAQLKLNDLMKPHEKLGMLPSQIQIKGNRNLIPVAVQKPQAESVSPVQVALQAPAPLTPPVAAPPQILPESIKPMVEVSEQIPNTEIASPVIATTELVQPEATKPEVVTGVPHQAQQETAKTPDVDPTLSSLATLKDIEQQRNPKRKLDVKLTKSTLKINKDILDLTIKSSHDGYVYMVLLGSDAKNFYILYPNGLDNDNRIKAGESLRLPKPDWQIKAAGPVGTNNILIMVSDTPRKLDKLVIADATASEPFTYALNNLSGRSSLINFLTGSGVDGRSENFGAMLLTVKEEQ